MSRLAFLREGIPEHTITVIPGTDEKLALVALNIEEIVRAKENSMNYFKDKEIDENTADLILNMFILAECMRVPDNLEEHFVGNFEEINKYMDPYIVYELAEQYSEVQSRSIVEFNKLSVKEFEEVKKNLEKLHLNELDGELQRNLMYCHLMMSLKGLLTDK